MNKQLSFLPKILIVAIFIGAIFGCGVTSNNSAPGGKSGSSITNGSSQSLSPGELTRLNNQSIVGKPSDENEELQVADQITPLYNNLSSSNPKDRKTAEKMLMNLVTYDPQFLEELKAEEKNNTNPNSWYAAKQIIEEAEKEKADANDELINRAIAQGKADAESNSN
ncbi:MAG: hypothetical protein ACHQYP_08120 [Nitrospiria bacterium]